MTRYLVYLVRWQLFTRCLPWSSGWCISLLWQTAVANLVGGLISLWVNRFIRAHGLGRELGEGPRGKGSGAVQMKAEAHGVHTRLWAQAQKKGSHAMG
jgi:hypothetical protein